MKITPRKAVFSARDKREIRAYMRDEISEHELARRIKRNRIVISRLIINLMRYAIRQGRIKVEDLI